jgi:hypothetical protein
MSFIPIGSLSPTQAHPSDYPLYGGISGTRLPCPTYELSDGVFLRSTYAHVFAPYMLSLSRRTSETPFGEPWKPASGGLGFDIEFEIEIPKGERPTNFTRINTIWWIASLIRLHQAIGLRVPVVSSMSFSTIAGAKDEPILWPIEMSPRQWIFDRTSNATIHASTLDWLKVHWQSAATLMDSPSFNVAFQAFDQAMWSHPIGSALMMIWASVEALIRPGDQDITRTLCSCIAAYLEPPGTQRDRLFTTIRDLYKMRGFTAHAAEPPDEQTIRQTFEVVRRCFIRAFEQCVPPDSQSLMHNWKQKL